MSVLSFVTVVETPEFIRRADELMLTAFAKNQRADLSQEDRNAFRRLTKALVETYRRRTR